MRTLNKIILAIFFLVFVLVESVFALEGSDKKFSPKMINTIKFDQTNGDIKFLQQTLYSFGYYKVEEDEPKFSEKFDEELKEGLIDFQKTNELKSIAGILNVETIKILNEFLTFNAENVEEPEGKIEEKNNPLFSDTLKSNLFADLDSVLEGSSNQAMAEVKNEVKDVQQMSPIKSQTQTNFIFQTILDFFLGKKETPIKNATTQYDIFSCIEDENCKYEAEPLDLWSTFKADNSQQ